ncbi:HXXEE domain-containing protein [Hyphomicrobium sp.]|uniref:HXXEE domain-containing protein n=1 Tax=Hyphomicrobium sp. TaxID=82 RepID=UPI003F6F792C
MIKSWLETHWVAGALFMSLAFLLLVPVTFAGEGQALLLIFLASPVYMLHQLEEHTGDRFRAYINRTVFGGVQALSVSDVLWINLPGVWGLNFAALYAAHFIDVGWGVAAGYLILINAIAHIGMAVRFRGYNPGLATGIVMFVPFGLATILLVPATLSQHAFGFAIALAIHAAIAMRANHNATAARRMEDVRMPAAVA